MRSLGDLNASTDKAFDAFITEKVCRSQRFAALLRALRPFADETALRHAARVVWLDLCGPVEWEDAIGAHPRLGDRRVTGTEGGEQRAVLESMDDAKATALATLNERYAQRFGYTFLLCAPGVPAYVVEERILERLNNSAEQEIFVAASEHAKITEGRLNKELHLQQDQDEMAAAIRERAASPASHAAVERQLSPTAPAPRTKPPVTTHVLDISRGRPASGIVVTMSKRDASGSWTDLGSGETDSDGRCMTLIGTAHILAPGQYKLTFGTETYLEVRCVAPCRRFRSRRWR